MSDQPLQPEESAEVFTATQLRGQRERFLAKLAIVARKVRRTHELPKPQLPVGTTPKTIEGAP